ncbi:MAG: cyclic pyranopterin monophosphate synthase MoaC [Candidatus Krumholzibacteriota bacterium]
MTFNHFDDEGRAHMVDVREKDITDREARAEAVVHLGPELLAAVQDREIAKGDVFGVARLAGIAAVKKTSDLIPLAHPLAIHHAAVEFFPDTTAGTVRVVCTVRAREKTGVEMEAMTGASVAALAVYDMCKGRDKSISIGEVRLLYKSGGKSGTYRAGDGAGS